MVSTRKFNYWVGGGEWRLQHTTVKTASNKCDKLTCKTGSPTRNIHMVPYAWSRFLSLACPHPKRAGQFASPAPFFYWNYRKKYFFMKHDTTSWAFTSAQGKCRKQTEIVMKSKALLSPRVIKMTQKMRLWLSLRLWSKWKHQMEELGLKSVDAQNPVCEAQSWQQGHSSRDRLSHLLQDTHQGHIPHS